MTTNSARISKGHPLWERFKAMRLVKRTVSASGSKVTITELRRDPKTGSKQTLKYTLDLP